MPNDIEGESELRALTNLASAGRLAVELQVPVADIHRALEALCIVPALVLNGQQFYDAEWLPSLSEWLATPHDDVDEYPPLGS